MSSAPAGLEKKKCEKDKIVRDLIALVGDFVYELLHLATSRYLQELAKRPVLENLPMPFLRHPCFLFQQPPFARIFRSAPDYSVIDDTDFTREKTRREVSRALANWCLRLQCAGGLKGKLLFV